MPFNGLGIYTAPAADFPVVTNTVISSTHFNNTINDIATALSSTLTKDGQNALTANLPGGGFRVTNIGITGINGSVGTPTINVGDAGTGLYRSALNELAVTVNGTQRGRFDSTGLIVTGVGTFSTSVVTPLVGPATANPLDFQTSGTSRWRINDSTGHLNPFVDNSSNLGDPALRIAKVFTPIIDSGTTGSLSLKTNNGETIATFNRNGAIANQWDFFGSPTGNSVFVRPGGSDTDVGVDIRSKGVGTISLTTNGVVSPSTQVQVLHTASANRNITVTGSNGGNPTIGVTAGSLVITPNVIISGTLTVTNIALSVGANPAAGGTLNIPYANVLASRNNANSGDTNLIFSSTINTVADTVSLGIGSTGVVLQSRSKAGAPSTSDIAAGVWTLWRDTSGSTTKLYYNNAGSLQSVALV